LPLPTHSSTEPFEVLYFMTEETKVEEQIILPKKSKKPKPIRKRKREDEPEEDPQVIKFVEISFIF
jgi:hypothetical protein